MAKDVRIKFGTISLENGRAVGGHGATLEDYEAALAFAAWCQRFSQWWLGDLLIRLDNRTGGEQSLPDDISEEHLARVIGVARRCPPRNRHHGLSYSHHAQGAGRLPLDEQADALAYADDNGLTSGEFRRYCAERVAAGELNETDTQGADV